MLTKQDLSLIQKLLNPIHTDIKDLKTDVSDLKTDVSHLQKDVTIIKKDVKKLQKDTKKAFDFHDKHHIHVTNNVKDIQRYLSLPVMQIDPEV